MYKNWLYINRNYFVFSISLVVAKECTKVPVPYEGVSQNSDQVKAMREEIPAILEQNQTWDLVPKPKL